MNSGNKVERARPDIKVAPATASHLPGKKTDTQFDSLTLTVASECF